MTSLRQRVASALDEMALLLSLKGESPFRVRAFEKAARSVSGRTDLEELAARGQLTSIDRVGTALAGLIAELVATGSAQALEALRREVPAALLDIVRIPGLGPKRAAALWRELGVTSLETFQQALEDGRVASLPGFGRKSVAALAEGLSFVKRAAGRWRLDQGLRAAEEARAAFLGSELAQAAGVTRVEIAGEARRALPIVTRTVLAVACARPEALDGQVIDGVGAQSPTTPPVLIRAGSAEAFGTTWLQATGSDAHLLALWQLGTHAFERPAATEEEIYERLGLAFVPPELREADGEVEAAAAGTPFTLLSLGDIRGVFHVHSTHSDGRATLSEICERAVEMGYTYVGITEHSPAAVYANGLSPERVEAAARELDALRPRFPSLTLFHGTEADILPDGSIDYGDDFLARFDFVIASVHSAFHLSGAEQTARLLRAVRNPRVTMLGHATGRRLLERPGLEADMEAVLRGAADAGCLVETNASPHRMELEPRLGALARRLGVGTSINPDAHDLDALGHVAYGVGLARKAGYAPEGVLNTLPAEAAAGRLRELRARR